MGRDAYMAAVDGAREQMRLGEFFEVVLSHSFVGTYDRSPLELYRRFREINPSPYQFYIDYGDEALVGASAHTAAQAKTERLNVCHTMAPASGSWGALAGSSTGWPSSPEA
jgi:anthranilate/para-aminobenzoate synthase component I